MALSLLSCRAILLRPSAMEMKGSAFTPDGCGYVSCCGGSLSLGALISLAGAPTRLMSSLAIPAELLVSWYT